MSRGEDQLIIPDWPAADNVYAYSTTRLDAENTGCSQGAYSHFNLANHVGDSPQHVQSNRQQLVKQLNLPAEPLWLEQMHGIRVFNSADIPVGIPQADASYSVIANNICVVMTADCLPVLICNRKGTKVAAAHAGWRGLAAGVIEASILALNEKPSELLVWLGPAIGPKVFEVGENVRRAFIDEFKESAIAFSSVRAGHYLADIYQLARLRLKKRGICAVYGGEYCTYTDNNRFYSYRRDVKTGRQASLIWFA
ncbi:FIG00003370: Multicopper polyphenol oxidase [hydrothermal vent metagenome]|uniref:FIG00003370: Multicopper polyphenol oxidase n=1 Tax=hydrothermal vent metagenome TaxID=652676 RepID=A0A3B0X2X5_9ZZZZ